MKKRLCHIDINDDDDDMNGSHALYLTLSLSLYLSQCRLRTLQFVICSNLYTNIALFVIVLVCRTYLLHVFFSSISFEMLQVESENMTKFTKKITLDLTLIEILFRGKYHWSFNTFALVRFLLQFLECLLSFRFHYVDNIGLIGPNSMMHSCFREEEKKPEEGFSAVLSLMKTRQHNTQSISLAQHSKQN